MGGWLGDTIDKLQRSHQRLSSSLGLPSTPPLTPGMGGGMPPMGGLGASAGSSPGSSAAGMNPLVMLMGGMNAQEQNGFTNLLGVISLVGIMQARNQGYEHITTQSGQVPLANVLPLVSQLFSSEATADLVQDVLPLVVSLAPLALALL